MKKVRLKITTHKGRLMCQYQGQNEPQDRYIEVSADGELYITYNSEIGNAVPARIYHGIEHRIHGNWETKKAARQFIADNRVDLSALVSGMGERWDGNNNIGTLTDEAQKALERLEYAAQDNY